MSLEDKTSFKPKRDVFQRKRGQPQFLDIICSQCQAHVAVYQKDGPGALFRLYLDRIFAPEKLSALQDTTKTKGDLEQLKCPNGHLLGYPIMYEPEQRLAFVLIRGSFAKRKHQ